MPKSQVPMDELETLIVQAVRRRDHCQGFQSVELLATTDGPEGIGGWAKLITVLRTRKPVTKPLVRCCRRCSEIMTSALRLSDNSWSVGSSAWFCKDHTN